MENRGREKDEDEIFMGESVEDMVTRGMVLKEAEETIEATVPYVHTPQNKTKHNTPKNSKHKKISKKYIVNNKQRNMHQRLTWPTSLVQNKQTKEKVVQKASTKRNFLHQILLLCRDIETNLGPMPDSLKAHLPTHKRRSKTYFIPSTIKLQP
jgi:hypothetical protein